MFTGFELRKIAMDTPFVILDFDLTNGRMGCP